MSNSAAKCLSDADVAVFLSGGGGADLRHDWQRHIVQCQACSARVEDKDSKTVADETCGPTETSESLPREDSIPGYKILKELHRGGQGIVYQAVQKSTRRKVAVKVLLEGPFAGPDAKRRFEREIAVVGSLRHSNIVPIFDSGVTRGGYYFAMEYVRGEPLAQYVQEKKLSVDDTLRLFQKICEAVDHAHQKGIIHRDLKPSNILVDSSGEPRVLDFGLARVGAHEMDDSQAQLLSVTGQIMGTLGYMSPEQAAGRPDLVDMRSDVYALGVILYRILTDESPYDLSQSMASSLRNIQEVEPSRPSASRREVTDELDTIVLKALSKEKDRRYYTAGALGQDVGRYRAGEAIEAKRDSALYVIKKAVRRYRIPMALAAAFMILVTAAAVAMSILYSFAQRERERAEIQSRIANTESHRARQAETIAQRRARELESAFEELNASYNNLYFEQIQVAADAFERGDVSRFRDRLDACPPELRGWEWRYLNLCGLLAEQESRVLPVMGSPACKPKFSSEGEQFAIGGPDGKIRIFRSVDGDQQFVLEGHAGAVLDIEFSPDGQRMVSGDDLGLLMVWDLASRQEIFTLEGHEGPISQVKISTNGRYVATVGGGRILRWDLQEDEPIPIPFEEHSGIVPQAISRDHQYVKATVGISALWICSAQTGEPTYNVQDPYNLSAAVFSDDSQIVLLGGADGSVAVVQLTAGRETHTLIGRHEASIRCIDVSIDRQRVVTGDEAGIVKLWDLPSGAELHTFRGHKSAVRDVAIGRHGTRVLSLGTDGEVRLWRTGAQQPTLSWLHGGEFRRATAISNDGRWCATAGVPPSIAVYETSTGVVVETLSTEGRSITSITFSPDGRYLASAHGNNMVLLWDCRTWKPVNRRVVDFDIESLAFSPNGEVLSIGGRDVAPEGSGILGVWTLMEDELHALRVGTAGVTSQGFSPEGDRLAIVDSDGHAAILQVPSAKRLAPLSASGVRTMIFSPDGEKIIGGAENALYVWNSRTYQEQYQVESAPIASLCVSSDGARVAGGSIDGSIRVWDFGSGKLAVVLRHGSLRVASVAFASDGDRLVASNRNGLVRTTYATSVAGTAPESTAGTVKRRLLDITPNDGWEFPVRLACAFAKRLSEIEVLTPGEEYTYLDNALREIRSRRTARDPAGDRQLDVLEQVVMQRHAWLVIGPFRGGPDHVGLVDDLGPEQVGPIQRTAIFQGIDGPVSWQPFSTHAWDHAPESSAGRHCIDFIRLFPRSDHVIAYALTYFHSPTQQDVELRIGSDDGVRVWLNDEHVHTNAVYRPFREGEDRVNVTLRRGLNKLLVKVDQSGRAWGFAVELHGEDGWPAEVTWVTERELNNIVE